MARRYGEKLAGKQTRLPGLPPPAEIGTGAVDADVATLEQLEVRLTEVRSNWTTFTVDRPTLLKPLVECGGTIYYTPVRPTRTMTFAAQVIAAATSTSNGTCYFDKPGTWWAVLISGEGVTRAQCLLIAADQSVADSYLSRPRPNVAPLTQVTVTSAVAVSLLAAYTERLGVTIQNTGNGYVRVSDYSGVTPTAAVGWRLGPEAFMSWEGDLCTRDSLTAIAETVDCTVEVKHYRIL